MTGRLKIEVIADGLTVRTKGLSGWRGRELMVSVRESSLVPDAEAFLRLAVEYCIAKRVRIQAGETLTYGYWLTKFVPAGMRLLDTWEYTADGSEFVPGATLTLTYWRDQHLTCDRAGAEFAPPRPDQLVIVSAGVFEGERVQGIRYPSPEHMSGWWISTERYDGDITKLRREHLYHLTATRPELARYLALPHGYCFDLEHGERVWFDEEAAASSSE